MKTSGTGATCITFKTIQFGRFWRREKPDEKTGKQLQKQPSPTARLSWVIVVKKRNTLPMASAGCRRRTRTGSHAAYRMRAFDAILRGRGAQAAPEGDCRRRVLQQTPEQLEAVTEAAARSSAISPVLTESLLKAGD